MTRTKGNKAKGPQFTRFLKPIIEVLRESGGSGTSSEVTDKVIDRLSIPDDELSVILKSGQSRVYNQVHWARMYLVSWNSSAGSLRSATSTPGRVILNGQTDSGDQMAILNVELAWQEVGNISTGGSGKVRDAFQLMFGEPTKELIPATRVPARAPRPQPFHHPRPRNTASPHVRSPRR
jgi:hypothetical protein